MDHKLAFIALTLIVAVTAFPQRRTAPPPTTAKPLAARLLVQGTYEEMFQGVTSDGNAQGKLVIKFEAARWLAMGTNVVGNAEFSELTNAPAPYASGAVSYEASVKGSGSGGDSYVATSNLAGPITGEDVVLSVPESTDTGNRYKIKILINPKLKGKCSIVAVRNEETATSSDCRNGTYFFTASTPLQIDDNDDPAKAADTASVVSFGIELYIEPESGAVGETGQSAAGDANVYAWRGAVTNGSKEAGFKIELNKTKELPTEDKRGRSTRKLVFNATIVPGVPK